MIVVSTEELVAGCKLLSNKADMLDYLYDTVEDALLHKQYEVVDGWLLDLPVKTVSDTMLLGMLTITFPFSKRLVEREKFFIDVVFALRLRHTEEEVKELVEGLS